MSNNQPQPLAGMVGSAKNEAMQAAACIMARQESGETLLLEDYADIILSARPAPPPASEICDDCSFSHDGDRRPVCTEQKRWQDAIDRLVLEVCPDRDGSGTDSGDPLDVTLCEIGQAFGAIRNDSHPSASAVREVVQKMLDRAREILDEKWHDRTVCQIESYESVLRAIDNIDPTPPAPGAEALGDEADKESFIHDAMLGPAALNRDQAEAQWDRIRIAVEQGASTA